MASDTTVHSACGNSILIRPAGSVAVVTVELAARPSQDLVCALRAAAGEAGAEAARGCVVVLRIGGTAPATYMLMWSSWLLRAALSCTAVRAAVLVTTLARDATLRDLFDRLRLHLNKHVGIAGGAEEEARCLSRLCAVLLLQPAWREHLSSRAAVRAHHE